VLTGIEKFRCKY